MIELFPDFSEAEFEHDLDIDAIKALAQYLARERSKLLQFQKTVQEKLHEIKNSLTSFRTFTDQDKVEASLEDCKNLVEFVETSLLQVYLIINSPLLLPLLRVSNSCNFDRTERLLLRHQVRGSTVSLL